MIRCGIRLFVISPTHRRDDIRGFYKKRPRLNWNQDGGNGTSRPKRNTSLTLSSYAKYSNIKSNSIYNRRNILDRYQVRRVSPRPFTIEQTKRMNPDSVELDTVQRTYQGSSLYGKGNNLIPNKIDNESNPHRNRVAKYTPSEGLSPTTLMLVSA